MSFETKTKVPLPPSTTSLNSSLTGEAPRTLWMGDLNPLYNENTIISIFEDKGFKVNAKLIKNRKGVLIPCSNRITHDQMISERSQSPSPENSSTDKMININGMRFVDPHSTTLHHSGYCFVEFKSYDDAIKALRLNTQLIPNVKYHPDQNEVDHINTFMDQDPIDIFTPFYTNPDNNRTFRLSWAASTSLNAPSIQTPEYSMFIGDITETTTETDLMIFFQKYFKSINSVRIMTDPLSGQSRCFGFIRFGNLKDREDCIEQFNNQEVCGAVVRCALAAARSNSKQNIINSGRHEESGPYSYGHNRSRSYQGRNSMDRRSSYQFNHRKSNSWSSAERGTSPFDRPTYTVYIANLNQHLDEVEFFRLFQQAGKITSIKTFSDKRSALISYAASESAEGAIHDFNGKLLESTGVPMIVEWATNSSPHGHYGNGYNYRHPSDHSSDSYAPKESYYHNRNLSYSSIDSSPEMQNNGYSNYNNNYMLNNNNIANSYSLQNSFALNNNNSFGSNMYNDQQPNPRAAALLRNYSGNGGSRISPTSSNYNPNGYYNQKPVYDSNNMISNNNIWKS